MTVGRTWAHVPRDQETQVSPGKAWGSSSVRTEDYNMVTDCVSKGRVRIQQATADLVSHFDCIPFHHLPPPEVTHIPSQLSF